ncbi:MAG: sugar transferase [Gammaproteobacteria bacterium]|nr:sugar transferase [Gammaproteobacteria bacterium]
MKRSMDILLAVFGMIAVGWLIALCWLLASLDTRRNGFFTQQRVGKNGVIFNIIKIRTMRPVTGIDTMVTCRDDPRITRIGKLMRRFKLDELPQIINVLLGHMSFVGPRPDVAGYADNLIGEDRIVVTIRPGITGLATLAFRNEEDLLNQSSDPESYNRNVLFPAKVKINRYYIEHYSLLMDLHCILATLFPRIRPRILSDMESLLMPGL